MEKLNPTIFKLKAEIITPIHIDNWEVYDRLGYFVFDNWNVIQIVDRKWLVDCAKKDYSLFQQIILSIEKGNFVKLENLKYEFYEKYFEKNYVLKEIKIWNQTLNYLIMEWNKNNGWEIKRFISNKFWDIIISWSTLKGVFKTMFLFDKLNEVENKYYKKQAFELKDIDNSDKVKNIFSFIEFSDIKLNNFELKINKVLSHNKPKKRWNKILRWPEQILEMLVKGSFEIEINDLNWYFSKEKIEKMIKNYSTDIIAREENIVDNIWVWLNTDIINLLDDYTNKWKYPVKIWMFKKSLSYKIFWEDMIEDLNKIKWKEWLVKSRKLWVGDKTLYTDENQNPIWWISLEIDNE